MTPMNEAELPKKKSPSLIPEPRAFREAREQELVVVGAHRDVGVEVAHEVVVGAGQARKAGGEGVS